MADDSSPPQRAAASPGRPVVFGEVLFDVFPDGTEVLGGAAFNVAWTLRGLGADPLFVSRVGRDARGERVLDAMARAGLDRSGVQEDGTRPTGVVEVTLEGGEPSYRIPSDQAWDAIEAAPAREAARACGSPDVLYHGTLALRAEASRAARDALAANGLPVFLDANLRAPWWDAAMLRTALEGARWAKLNEEELGWAAGGGGTPDPADGDPGRFPAAREVLAAAGLDELVVTCGAGGALLVARGDGGAGRTAAPPPLERLLDTVGAGDAFAAAAILGLGEGWPAAVRLERAVELAAAVCGLRGATTEDLAFYRAFAARWAGGPDPG